MESLDNDTDTDTDTDMRRWRQERPRLDRGSWRLSKAVVSAKRPANNGSTSRRCWTPPSSRQSAHKPNSRRHEPLDSDGEVRSGLCACRETGEKAGHFVILKRRSD
ncbi:hypothetical protein LSAT2_029263 [Lamellibrachia satsuma]|nr:hypothetical protein LSAT2_029263 [Lamellibrachia satsuma]